MAAWVINLRCSLGAEPQHGARYSHGKGRVKRRKEGGLLIKKMESIACVQ